MSLFNKDFNNRSGIKCDVVYTDLLNDIPTGNIATKDWVTSQDYLASNIYNNNNSWTGQNTFNSYTIFSNTSSTYFLEPPNMSGANIALNTIQDTALSSNVGLLTNTQTWTGNNYFNNMMNIKNINFTYTDGTPFAYADENGNFFIGSLLNNVVETNYLYVNGGGSIRGVNFVAGANFYEEGGGVVASIDNTGIFECVGSITPITTDVSTKIATTEYVDNRINGNETISGTKTFSVNPIIKNQYLNGCDTLRAVNFSVTAPYFEFYPIAPTANQTITLPPASLSLLGVRLLFRRVGGTITVTVNSASANIYPNNSFTPNNVLLQSNTLNVVITCAYRTSTTYGWFVS